MNLKLSHIDKSYDDSKTKRVIFKDMSATLVAGKISVIVGKSGVGKSSLLNLISGIDLPDSGTIHVGDLCITDFDDSERTLFRRRRIGFIYQFFNLIPVLSVLENITLVAELDNTPKDIFLPRVMALLETVGLADRKNDFPDTLSGGEQQRVAIVRSLANDPDIILADEPTGNLDSETGLAVLEMITDLVKIHNKTLIMVTHSPEAMGFADHVYAVKDQLLVPQASGLNVL
ncbi:ABC transporter ATP-binding protein [Desulfobacter hydrogenophilus]|uniref:ABC transporter ATP-binding protein n=1 Tax=Desulfobacter hydrogenophilus TaxID=2291 RepID=A0A328FA81_9BACT|nr:ABC transporter ATP-binding protein [Desulfobacter hydrogenophilus]QBH14955.1 ABC transporter ATP-binding protein [Desulfobacter hydrogenophilus]RAL99992.1 ABC transporter ATP-binding protein [Desulfobacter hydrogenophilus]